MEVEWKVELDGDKFHGPVNVINIRRQQFKAPSVQNLGLVQKL